MKEKIRIRLQESIKVKEKLIQDDMFIEQISAICKRILLAYQDGGKVLLCGNGGSASDALHIAGELVGRFQKERRAFPAIALNADIATMTAIANDYGYEEIYARQVQAMMKKEDILICLSSSGNSMNLIKAVEQANKIGAQTIGLLGGDGGKLNAMVDYIVLIPSIITARIQEAHITTAHIICEIVEEMLL